MPGTRPGTCSGVVVERGRKEKLKLQGPELAESWGLPPTALERGADEFMMGESDGEGVRRCAHRGK